MKTKFFRQYLAILLLAGIVAANLFARSKNKFDIGNIFIPAGYMGCPDNINIDPAWNTNTKTGPQCFKITYNNTCPQRWAGMYWTNDVDEKGQANWGDLPGTDLSGQGYRNLKFWARGDKGEEMIEFGLFGINRKTYKDSCPKTTIPGRVVTLTNEWKQYTIPIACQDLKSVIGGFYWSASWNANPSGLTFYLDDIILTEEE